jgi:phage gp29-like protein
MFDSPVQKPSPPIRGEIATIARGRDITRGYVDGLLLLQPQDLILLNQAAGNYEVYERIAQDDQVQATLQQRRLAVVSREWEVEPGDDRRISQKAADFMREQLDHVAWDNLIEKMLWGRFYGFAVGEVIWATDGGMVYADRIKVRKQRRFGFGMEGELRLRTLQSWQGEPVPERKFWHFCCGADNDDEPYGLGLAHYLYWPVLFKKGGLKFWLTFCEKFAQPTAIGRYGPGTSLDDQDKLLEALGAIQTEAGVILPDGMLIELLEASRSGTSDYEALNSRMNAAISKIVLGQTMTTDDGSSLSQSQVHMHVRQDIVKADADLVNESFNRSVSRWLTDWNFEGAAYPRVWRRLEDEPDLKPQAERDKILFDMGFVPSVDYVVSTYGEGFKPPEEGEELDQPVPLNGAQVQSLTTMLAQAAQSAWPPALVDALLQAAFPQISAEIRAAISQGLSQQTEAEATDGAAPAPSLDTAAALFAEVEFAASKKQKGGKKKCVKGISCGSTCISARKVCRKDLTPEQQKKAAKTRGGDGQGSVTKSDKPITDKPITKKELKRALNRRSVAERDQATIELVASRQRAAQPQRHQGMSASEDMWSFEYEGTTFHDSGRISMDSPSVRLLTSSVHGQVPESLSSATENIYFSRQRCRHDQYWSERYGSEHISVATARERSIVFYDSDNLPEWSLRSVYVHEAAHNFAYQRWGSATPPVASDYHRAAFAGRDSFTTPYARKAWEASGDFTEDFAESVTNQVLGRGRPITADRAAVITRLLEEDGYGG